MEVSGQGCGPLKTQLREGLLPSSLRKLLLGFRFLGAVG